MKFNAYQWKEIRANVETPHKGQLRLSLSAKAALYITQEGYEALAGYGAAFELQTSEAVTFRVETVDPDLRVFLHTREPQSVVATGENFANADRMVMQSTHLAEVTRARRMFELEKRAALREIQAATAAARAAVQPPERAALREIQAATAAARAAVQPAPARSPEPALAPAPAPAGEAEADA